MVGTVIACVILVAIVWLLRRMRKSPEELERLRRELVSGKGRQLDGTDTDIDGATVHFIYTVRGMEYQAAQDLSALRDRIPNDPELWLGPVTLKFMVDNPANSIVLAEDWSGFHTSRERGA